MTWHRCTSEETKARVPAVREQILTGRSQTEIARALGLTKSVVVGICHRHLRDEWAARPNAREAVLPGRRGPKGMRLLPGPTLQPLPCVAVAEPVPVAVPIAAPEPPQIEAPAVVVVPAPPVLSSWLTLPIPPARSCQWPLVPWRRPWPLCGAAVDGAGPYCCDHKRIAYAGVARRVAA